MKKHINSFLLIISMFIGLTSCSDHTLDPNTNSILGNWNVVSMMGQGGLSDILSITIDETTVTMKFKEGGDYGTLFEEYGESNTVSYTYKADDVDLHGTKGISLTFDEPLYFEPYSTSNNYITKVFIEMKDRYAGVDGIFLSWSCSARSHVLTFSR